MTQHVGICRQQGEPLIHDSLLAADLAHFAIPASIGKAAILNHHRFDLRLLNQHGELKMVYIADTDHADAAGVISGFFDGVRLPSSANAG